MLRLLPDKEVGITRAPHRFDDGCVVQPFKSRLQLFKEFVLLGGVMRNHAALFFCVHEHEEHIFDVRPAIRRKYSDLVDVVPTYLLPYGANRSADSCAVNLDRFDCWFRPKAEPGVS